MISNEYIKDIERLLKATDDINFKIRMLRHNNQKLTAENDESIKTKLLQLEDVELQIEEALTKSKEDAIKTKIGWAHFKVMPDQYVFGDEAIEEIHHEYPDLVEKYIKAIESLKLNPLKKDLESGEISLKNYTKEPQKKKFEYKFTGE